MHSESALEQAQGCLEATTESISHVMLILQQLEKLPHPERATRVVGNERPQDSYKEQRKDNSRV